LRQVVIDPRAVTGVMMVASTTGSITFISYIAHKYQIDKQTGRQRVDGEAEGR
jgi:hypothetical protein